ncbi:MAG: glycosyl transferase [Aeriscardovia sp.]|nr:glycosyl transferase [Aeriscardovia sp.]
MIPKIIHYCWFGRNPMSKLAKKCIRSWKRKCRGYDIIEWNENNFDIQSSPLYVQQAYEAKKWAFVTDYVRLKVVFEHGGIYLDTDVEIIKNLDSFLGYHAFFGFEDGKHIATGLGFGAEKGTEILAELMSDYDNLVFYKTDGTLNTISCPVLNTSVFIQHGLVQNNSYQVLDGDIHIFPKDVFCPIDYQTGVRSDTKESVSVHWFDASWQTNDQRTNHLRELKRIQRDRIKDTLFHTPNRIMLKLLGSEKYETLKKALKR